MVKADSSGRFRNKQTRFMLMAMVLTLALPILGIGVMRASAQSGTATATATACPPATPTSGTPTPNLCVEIGEFDIFFKPNLATIPADTAVRVVLVNHGAALHNFSITDHKNPGLEKPEHLRRHRSRQDQRNHDQRPGGDLLLLLRSARARASGDVRLPRSQEGRIDLDLRGHRHPARRITPL